MIIPKWFLIISLNLFFSSVQAFVNPITDICWECLFPILLGGVKVTPKYEDQVKHSEKLVCKCAGKPPTIGVPLTFWEPLYLIDVTTHSYKMVGLGGIKLSKETIKNRGCIGIVADGPCCLNL